MNCPKTLRERNSDNIKKPAGNKNTRVNTDFKRTVINVIKKLDDRVVTHGIRNY